MLFVDKQALNCTTYKYWYIIMLTCLFWYAFTKYYRFHSHDSWKLCTTPSGINEQLASWKIPQIFLVHPGRLTWNLQITHLERKMIFQTSIFGFHVNLPGCKYHPKLGGIFQALEGLNPETTLVWSPRKMACETRNVRTWGWSGNFHWFQRNQAFENPWM